MQIVCMNCKESSEKCSTKTYSFLINVHLLVYYSMLKKKYCFEKKSLNLKDYFSQEVGELNYVLTYFINSKINLPLLLGFWSLKILVVHFSTALNITVGSYEKVCKKFGRVNIRILIKMKIMYFISKNREAS